ncbi:hypothetical protein GGTG_02948 [Gaeumannomyces tritici R3-111a-1]|uniref:Uncharacterized protein n=1 Tax=Gaeumannomyces tritici (strain R3-111a-1) TaxID=644352 RepID=J3NNU2_GAET3|nr:hypothetical protein GGTG_02948 [Gaeumannomyces tritici R3-111a-1]EJT77845.1 hypothetical protein GGTG_02948 [Gaeumannomyces tritici R3-111a-1]
MRSDIKEGQGCPANNGQHRPSLAAGRLMGEAEHNRHCSKSGVGKSTVALLESTISRDMEPTEGGKAHGENDPSVYISRKSQQRNAITVSKRTRSYDRNDSKWYVHSK